VSISSSVNLAAWPRQDFCSAATNTFSSSVVCNTLEIFNGPWSMAFENALSGAASMMVE
jgi:hypothetical protein